MRRARPDGWPGGCRLPGCQRGRRPSLGGALRELAGRLGHVEQYLQAGIGDGMVQPVHIVAVEGLRGLQTTLGAARLRAPCPKTIALEPIGQRPGHPNIARTEDISRCLKQLPIPTTYVGLPPVLSPLLPSEVPCDMDSHRYFIASIGSPNPNATRMPEGHFLGWKTQVLVQ